MGSLLIPVIYYAAVHGLKLEIRNSGEMKQVSELDVYKPTEMLSDMVRHNFDKGKHQNKSIF